MACFSDGKETIEGEKKSGNQAERKEEVGRKSRAGDRWTKSENLKK